MDDFDLPRELFRTGSDEETAANHLKHLENAIVGELVRTLQGCKAPEAAQHFQGCSRRLLMMRHARVEIYATAMEEEKPLEDDKLTLLNICLNSYYLNLLGALDNLAWGSTFELHLLANIDENDLAPRRFCTLANPKFVESISQRNVAFKDFLTTKQAWIQEVKRFRDPAAHRLPLAIVRGVMTEEEGQRYRELWEASTQALLDDRWEESEALRSEAERLGKFVPYLDGPRAPGEGIYIVPNQMAADQREFLSVTHTFIKYLAAAAV